MDRRFWADIWDVPPGPSLSCGGRSCWMEILTVACKVPLGGRVGRVGPGKSLEIGCDGDKMARLGLSTGCVIQVRSDRLWREGSGRPTRLDVGEGCALSSYVRKLGMVWEKPADWWQVRRKPRGWFVAGRCSQTKWDIG